METQNHTDIFSEYANDPSSKPLPAEYQTESDYIIQEYREHNTPQSPKQYAAYDDDGIWMTGPTPEAALADYADINRLSPEEMEEIGLDTAPMTPRLAEKVEAYGYDCAHPGYCWRVLPDGTLDLEDEIAE